MVKHVAVLCLLFSLSALTASANDWFVAPNGTGSGAGTMASPWDLQTALNGGTSGQIRPGDTVWMLPGTYISTSGGFISYLNGTATLPIIVRDYNEANNKTAWLAGQRATIDSNNQEQVLQDGGSYTWFWGWEGTDSQHPTREPTGETPPFGILCDGPGSRFINLIIHDTGQGFSCFIASPNTEFSDNLVYYNGYTAPDRNHGHGIYVQNSTGTKLLAGNFVFDNADEGLQLYGSGNAVITGLTVENNTLFDTSSWPAIDFQYNLVLGNGNCTQNVLTNNYSFFIPNYASGFFAIGQYGACNNISATNNYIVGGYVGVELEGNQSPFTFTGNTVYAAAGIPGNNGAPLSLLRMNLFGSNQAGFPWPEPVETTAGYTVDNNSYYGDDEFEFGTETISSTGSYSDEGSPANFAGWKSATGLDANSTFTAGTPPATRVFITPNRYESKRAGITIFNWQNLSTVPVDVSGVLSIGDPYVVQDVQNFFGPAIIAGTYQGGTLNIPMTSTAKAPVIGLPASEQPPHTAPYGLGTFIILSANSTNLIAPGNAPPIVSISSPASGSTLSGSVTVAASVSDTVAIASVQFTLDGSSLGASVTSPPYSITWNTAQGAAGNHTLGAVAVDTSGNMASASIVVNVSSTSGTSPSSSTASATFLQSDATTQGNWQGVYGGDGYALAQGTQTNPAYGKVAIQNEGGWTWSTNTTDPRALENPTGTGRFAAAWYSDGLPAFSLDINITDGNVHQFALYALDWDAAGRSETVQIINANTNAVLDTRSISGFTNGVYLVWSISGHVTVTITSKGGPNAVVSGVFWGSHQGTSTGGTGGSGTAANFVLSDAATQGNWPGKYGADGYDLAGTSAENVPAYAGISLQNASAYTWNSSTTDPRALVTPGSAGSFAATWYSNAGGESFSINLNFTDGASHQVALYALDWDGEGRSENIQIVNTTTGAVLDTRSISGFANGVYLVWNLSGSLTINVTRTGGPNAVVSGIFFGMGATGNSAIFVSTDATTQGSWEGVYGKDGYDIADTTPSAVPSYVTVSLQSPGYYVWTSDGTETRDLEIPPTGATLRGASCWYTPGAPYSLDLDFRDASVHSFELYALDWDNQGRSETIQITDASSGAVLDTRTVTNFSQGIYYIWKLSGHLHVTVTPVTGPNAVLSGAFFN